MQEEGKDIGIPRPEETDERSSTAKTPEDLEGRLRDERELAVFRQEEGVERAREELSAAERATVQVSEAGLTEPERQKKEMYEKIQGSALKLFNERVLRDGKENPVTLADLQAMPDFMMFSTFRDLDTGQKYEIVMDRKKNNQEPFAEGKKDIRISLFDHTPQFMDEVRHHYNPDSRVRDKVLTNDVGVRVYPHTILSYDRRRNPQLPAPLPSAARNLYAPGWSGDSYQEYAGLVTTVLERSLDPEKTKVGMWHTRKAPRQAEPR